MHASIRHLFLLTGLFAAFTLTSCDSLPDLKPFSDSTAQLAASVRGSGQNAVADLQTLKSRYLADAKNATGDNRDQIKQDATALAKQAEQFEAAWNATTAMMDATATYADSITQIAAAGKEGADRAKQVGTSIKSLLDSVGTVVPGADTIVSIGSKAYGEIVQHMAGKSLDKALAEAQPAIDDVARVLEANLASLAKINKQLTLELVTTTEDATRAGFNVANEQRVLRLALAAHDEMRKEIGHAIESNADDSAKREAALNPLLLRSKQLEEIIAGSRAKLTPINTAAAAAQEKGRNQTHLLEAAQVAVQEWAAYHRALRPALSENHIPSVAQLNAAANDVREFLTLIRKQP